MDATTESLQQDILAFFQTPTGFAAIGMAGLLYSFVWCRVFAKAGFHSGMGLLMVIPPLMFVMPFWLAFVPWPVEREMRGLKRLQKAVHKADERQKKFTSAA